MKDNGFLFPFAFGIVLFNVIYASSKWENAMRDCTQQCASIENNVAPLHKYYKDSSTTFWLPKAEVLTPWIEQLGCASTIVGHISTPPKMSSLGLCYDLCSTNNKSYFSYKDSDCVCLENSNAYVGSEGTQNHNCTFLIYKILDAQLGLGDGDCATTTCKYLSENAYIVDTLKAAECKPSYNINSICGNGEKLGSFISHEIAMSKCNKVGSHLPGTNDSSCQNIANSHQGVQTHTMWSSIFKTRFSKTFTLKDLNLQKPVTCFSGRFMTPSSESYNEYIEDCEKEFVYICEVNVTKCTRHKSESEKSSTVAVLVGVVVGLAFPMVILVIIVFIILKRKSTNLKKRQAIDIKDVQMSVVAGFSNEHEPGNSTGEKSLTTHVKGTVNNDEYAVVSKPDVRSSVTKNMDASIVYMTPSTEYDKLDRSNRKHFSNSDNAYSKPSNYARYNIAFPNTQQNNRMDDYDHVTSDVIQAPIIEDSAYV